MFRFLFSAVFILAVSLGHAAEPLCYFNFKNNRVYNEPCQIQWPSGVITEDIFPFRPRAKGTIYLFLNGRPLRMMASADNGKTWSDPVTVTNSVNATVTSAVMYGDGSMTAYFHNDSGVVFSTQSSDGMKWSFPVVAFKHNSVQLDNAMVGRASRNRMYALMHEKGTSRILYSQSRDGVSWSYPRYLENQPEGQLVALSVRNESYYLVFCDEENIHMTRTPLRHFGEEDSKYAMMFSVPRGDLNRTMPVFVRMGRDHGYLYD